MKTRNQILLESKIRKMVREELLTEEESFTPAEIIEQLKNSGKMPDVYGYIQTMDKLICLGKTKAYITDIKYGSSSGRGNTYDIERI